MLIHLILLQILKKQIEDNKGIKIKNQRLLFHGKDLEDKKC